MSPAVVSLVQLGLALSRRLRGGGYCSELVATGIRAVIIVP